jgi:hypothetical protein
MMIGWKIQDNNNSTTNVLHSKTGKPQTATFKLYQTSKAQQNCGSSVEVSLITQGPSQQADTCMFSVFTTTENKASVSWQQQNTQVGLHGSCQLKPMT